MEMSSPPLLLQSAQQKSHLGHTKATKVASGQQLWQNSQTPCVYEKQTHLSKLFTLEWKTMLKHGSDSRKGESTKKKNKNNQPE